MIFVSYILKSFSSIPITTVIYIVQFVHLKYIFQINVISEYDVLSIKKDIVIIVIILG